MRHLRNSHVRHTALGLGLWALGFALLAVMVAAFLPADASAATASAVFTPDMLVGGGSVLGVAGMISWDWTRSAGGPVMSRQELERLANPQSANQNEVIPHILFDTQSIANAAAGPHVFFQALQTDKTLGNVPGPGQLPDPYFFVIQYIACDFLVEAATGDSAAFTPVSDVSEILIAQRATFQATINDKTYGPYPLVSCHGLGGVNMQAVLEGATAAPGAGVYNVNNGSPGSGGFFVGGAWTIGPKVGYSVQINTAAAPTLSATIRVRMSLVGTLYRAVR